MSRFFFVLLLVVTACLAVLLGAMNPIRVQIELAFTRVATPLGVALVVAFALGLLGGLIWQMKWISQLLMERGRLRRALRLAESKARVERHRDA